MSIPSINTAIQNPLGDTILSKDFDFISESDSDEPKPIGKFDIIRMDNNSIWMCSGDQTFLKEKWEVISEYTKKIDPEVNIGNFEIQEITLSEIPEPTQKKTNRAQWLERKKIKELIEIRQRDIGLLEKNFTHRICLDLPRLVKILQGEHSVNTGHGNCHGAAVVVSGLFPAMANFESPFDLAITSAKAEKIAIEKIASGDLVYLNSSSWKRRHSFVFLDHDISISMNGQGQNLDIYDTSSILAEYGYPEGCLKFANPPLEEHSSCSDSNLKDRVAILRKIKDWRYPETIMTTLIDFYEMNPITYMDSSDSNYPKLWPIAEVFQRYALQTHSTEEERLNSRSLFRAVTNCMPYWIKEGIKIL